VWAGGIVVGTSCVLLCGYWLRTAPLFAITRVETGPYRYTSAQQLEQRLATLLGQNIWSSAATVLADSVETMPWVRDVQIRRLLPATVKVDFQEWRPVLEVVAQAKNRSANDMPLVLLADGRVVEFPDGLPKPSLPVLVEVSLQPRAGGVWTLAGQDVPLLLELVSAIAETGLEATEPIDFILAQDDGYAIVLQGRPGRLLLGKADFSSRLQQYLIARDKVGEDVDVDLRFRERVTLRKRKA
jgi:cell division septal protein FtsQ